jgi:predicted nucleic acid-binding protein
MTTLLDTSVVIDCLRLRPRAVAFFEALDAQPSISVITIAEVMVGARNAHEERDAAAIWRLVKVLRIDADIAHRAGSLVRIYASSHAVELPDAIIAATAEQNNLRLATLNRKHFPMFPRLKRPY